MAETTATPSTVANIYSWLISLSPSINAAITSLAVPVLCVMLGVGGAVGYQKATAVPALPMALPDLPKPVPTVSVADVDHLIGLHCADVKSMLAEIKDRLPPLKKGGTK